MCSLFSLFESLPSSLYINIPIAMYTATQLLPLVNTHLANLQFARAPQGLYAPISYVLSLGGKRIRPVLMLMAYNLYHDDVRAILQPAAGIEVYHNYTLLHDDLMDRADRRRGKATVHKVWNDNTAILSGDAMLVLAYQLMSQCPADKLAEVVALFSRTAMEICEGQQFDMEFENRLDVREEEYIEMIRLKTSVLLACSLKIGAVLGGASASDADHLYRFGIHMGLAFQLQDDLLDVYGDPAVFGKNIGGDILCNKKTYMLIQALRLADAVQAEELNRWINATDFEPAEKIAAVTRLYDAMNIRTLCERKMEQYNLQAEADLAAVSQPADRKAELLQLLRTLVHRKL